MLKAHQLSALILDDQSIMRDIIRSHLVAMGFNDIHVAANVEEADKEMRRKRFDIVFVDWILPGESGIYFLEQYRRNKAYDKVAFVMVTVQSELKHVTAAMAAGATSYIIKPLVGGDFQAIVSTVIEWVNMARMPKKA